MVFSSLEFLLAFLPVTLLLYYAVPLRWRNIVLLVTSLIFYGWGEPVYVFLMMFTIAVDYVCGYFTDKFRAARNKSKAWMIAAVVVNLAILGFFKYYNFFAGNLRLIPGLEGIPALELELPIGISFYTFQSLSYVIDVYRNDARVQKNIASFGTYVTLFPQLIAGPIVRYADVDEQLRSREHSVALFASGVRTFTAGFAKKVLLANTSGELWNHFYSIPTDSRTVLGAWLGIIFYTFQIYFDFSGYSDMAIGLGKMLGFRFLENFNYPYVAKSITDFWRRWHISLSSWFREYVYFPLGGSRVDAKWKLYRNLFVVWFLTGFWHGASWNFIIWGLYYFVILVIEKAFLLRRLEKAPAIVTHLYTMALVLFGWLIFVFDGSGDGLAFTDGVAYLGNMFGANVRGFADSGALFDLSRSLVLIAALVFASTPVPKRIFYRLYEKSRAWRWIFAAGGAALFVAAAAYLVDGSFNPFLYFQF